MIDLKTFENLAGVDVGEFALKPTSLTEGQKEASVDLWTSADGYTHIGVWECTPGRFGSGTREVGPGDLLVLPRGWTGEWVILEHIRKLYVIDTSPAA